jgi:UDP-N-acetylglucosamine 2-epimerase
MIHIAIGTKAQAIKMAPIIRLLKQKGIALNLIDLGQHSLITKNLREEFGLDEPSAYLSKGSNVSSLAQAFLWLIEVFFKSLSSLRIKREIFLNQGGICLIHGDTASTLIGLYLAKRARLKVAHIEAGLRSFNWLNPFPEEIFRVIAMRFSDILFAPSGWAFYNLERMGLKENSILISANTSIESTLYSLNKTAALGLGLEKFALVTIHRMENIFSRKKLELIIAIIAKISQRLPVVFVQHSPTINQLKSFKLEGSLNELNNIHFLKILSHRHFIHLLKNCEFVITDGGSIQEESYFLDKPCLLLRNHTERMEGLGENALLSEFLPERINYFLERYQAFKRKAPLDMASKPSEEIVQYLMEETK